MLRTFVKKMGGPAAIVEMLKEQTGTSLSEGSVKMWVWRDRVPFKWRAVLCREANRRGIQAPESVKAGVLVND